MNLNNDQPNNVAMEAASGATVGQNPTPPISKDEHEQDKKDLTRAEFVEEYMQSSGADKTEAEEMADEIYGKA